jgi:hypothetical protein
MLGVYCLEVGLHPEGPSTGQLDERFPRFSSVLEQILSWYPNSTLHCFASHAVLTMVASKYRLPPQC